MVNNYHSSTHLKYLCRYHVIFCPKYRRKIVINGIDLCLKRIFIETARAYRFHILEMEVMPDHVHLLIDCNPRYGITRCVANLKQKSSSELRHQFPDVIRGSASIWTRSSFIATVGSVSLETVKNYILSQKDHV